MTRNLYLYVLVFDLRFWSFPFPHFFPLSWPPTDAITCPPSVFRFLPYTNCPTFNYSCKLPQHPLISLLCHNHLEKLQHLLSTISGPITQQLKAARENHTTWLSDFIFNSWTQISCGESALGNFVFFLFIARNKKCSHKAFYKPLTTPCSELISYTAHLRIRSHKYRNPSLSHHQNLWIYFLLFLYWSFLVFLYTLIIPNNGFH